MNSSKVLFLLLLCAGLTAAQGQVKKTPVDFYGHQFYMLTEGTLAADLPKDPSATAVKKEYQVLNAANYQSLIDSLLAYKVKYQLNDWLYYQLVRKVAQQLCPKEQNYGNYTLYKWFILAKSGYDARLALSNHRIIFYVFNDEDISDIPFFNVGNKKFMCLNYHDYADSNLNDDPPVPVTIDIPEAKNAFSYKVTRMPDFSPASYTEKKLNFTYEHKQYHFSIKLNPAVTNIFANYPGVDFETILTFRSAKKHTVP
jgi:hypothetical protein